MSTGAMILENTVLHQFLGADGIAELKSKLIDMIVDEVHDQLKQSSNYIISPDDIAEELYKDVVKDIRNEIILEYKAKISEAVDKKMAEIGL